MTTDLPHDGRGAEPDQEQEPAAGALPIGEFELIERLTPYVSAAGAGLPVGTGDDAAVIELGDRWVCLAVDVVVDGVHFDRTLSSLADVGWKAVAVNVSDLAAMGARPTAAVLGLCRPADLPPEDVDALYAGMDEACRRWGLRLVGGDTVSADALALSVTVLGEVTPGGAVRRSGARPGDSLVVVGALGAAAAGLALDRAGRDPDEPLLAAHRRPAALVDAGQILAEGGATAMIDVSDGLGADAGHLARASGVRARLRARDLPVAEGVAEAAAMLGVDLLDLVCGGGEDFALLAAVPADAARKLAHRAGASEGVPAAVVGEVLDADDDAPTVELEVADGTVRDITARGYDHFRTEEP